MPDLLSPAPPAARPPVPGAPPETGDLHLHPTRIIETIDALGDRIEERFPGSGLARVARQQLGIARNTLARVEWVKRPILWVRAAAGLVILLLVALVAGIALRVNVNGQGLHFIDVIQAVDAAINELILLGAAIVFLATTESRIKRKKALASLRELRALAHIVDMHQLTKDPERFTDSGARVPDTPSSPRRTLTRWELSRYLDYCSEMLALNSKLAALYAQTLDDPVVLAAVDEVETLTTGLCAKIWQKLVIVNRAGG
ncbi:MAG TPA: hypothetical protein VGC13_00700 [Longimicrobium sp.]|jgi:hypothetical protein|uniref:hypothetical protein n=1 Tax=Longimicrobium sp. TaxID=2029185 RepID=UPI002EDA942E